MLTDEGTIVLKFYLHMSKEVQLERLEERMIEPEKYWKSTGADFDSREHWDGYMSAYESVLERTDTEYAPWHIIPVDNKWYKLYLVAKEILAALRSIEMKWPQLTVDAIPESVRRDVEEKKARIKIEAEMQEELKKKLKKKPSAPTAPKAETAPAVTGTPPKKPSKKSLKK